MEECSFRPSIERKKYTDRTYLTENFSSRSKKTSYNLKVQEKENKRKDPIKVILKGKKKNEIGNNEKAIMRMSVGRKMREYCQIAMNRGYPREVENWISYQKREKEKIK